MFNLAQTEYTDLTKYTNEYIENNPFIKVSHLAYPFENDSVDRGLRCSFGQILRELREENKIELYSKGLYKSLVYFENNK